MVTDIQDWFLDGDDDDDEKTKNKKLNRGAERATYARISHMSKLL